MTGNPGDNPGNNPDETVEDLSNLTQQVDIGVLPADRLVTIIENTFHPGGPCGEIFWNRHTNEFKWYGFSFGDMSGVDLNRSAPAGAAGASTGGTAAGGAALGGPAGTQTLNPGDTWLAKSGCTTALVHFAGTSIYRTYGGVSQVTGGITDAFGVQVDQANGHAWFTERAGRIVVLDPFANT